MKYGTQTPYIAAFAIIRDDSGKVAFVLRKNTGWMDGYYGLASGKVEKGESYHQAAIREAAEETGITVESEDMRYVHTMHRKGDDSDWVDVFFEVVRYTGQVKNAEPDVHDEIAWFSLDSLPDNVIPQVRAALESLQEGKTYSEYGWS